MAPDVTIGRTKSAVENGKLDLSEKVESLANVNWNGNELQVTELKVANCPKLMSLRGIEKLQKLQKLDAEGCNIEDISALQSLRNLEEVKVKKNQVLNANALANHPVLESLNLSFNKLTQVPILSDCVNLRYLQLTNNNIKKIENLGSSQKLRVLGLGVNQISKIEGLETLTQLSTLVLSDNKISRIEGLSTLKNLELLYLAKNQISRMEGLESLINLTTLDLSINQIEEKTGLSTLKKLKNLILKENPVESIKDLVKKPPVLKIKESEIIIQHLTRLKTLAQKNRPNQCLFCGGSLQPEGDQQFQLVSRLKDKINDLNAKIPNESHGSYTTIEEREYNKWVGVTKLGVTVAPWYGDKRRELRHIKETKKEVHGTTIQNRKLNPVDYPPPSVPICTACMGVFEKLAYEILEIVQVNILSNPDGETQYDDNKMGQLKYAGLLEMWIGKAESRIPTS